MEVEIREGEKVKGKEIEREVQWEVKKEEKEEVEMVEELKK